MATEASGSARLLRAEVAEIWDDLRPYAVQVRIVGDQVVVVGGCAVRGRASGVVSDSPLAWVVTVRGGKITSHRGFRTAGEALEAAGVSEQGRDYRFGRDAANRPHRGPSRSGSRDGTVRLGARDRRAGHPPPVIRDCSSTAAASAATPSCIACTPGAGLICRWGSLAARVRPTAVDRAAPCRFAGRDAG